MASSLGGRGSASSFSLRVRAKVSLWRAPHEGEPAEGIVTLLPRSTYAERLATLKGKRDVEDAKRAAQHEVSKEIRGEVADWRKAVRYSPNKHGTSYCAGDPAQYAHCLIKPAGQIDLNNLARLEFRTRRRHEAAQRIAADHFHAELNGGAP